MLYLENSSDWFTVSKIKSLKYGMKNLLYNFCTYDCKDVIMIHSKQQNKYDCKTKPFSRQRMASQALRTWPLPGSGKDFGEYELNESS